MGASHRPRYRFNHHHHPVCSSAYTQLQLLSLEQLQDLPKVLHEWRRQCIRCVEHHTVASILQHLHQTVGLPGSEKCEVAAEDVQATALATVQANRYGRFLCCQSDHSSSILSNSSLIPLLHMSKPAQPCLSKWSPNSSTWAVHLMTKVQLWIKHTDEATNKLHGPPV